VIDLTEENLQKKTNSMII